MIKQVLEANPGARLALVGDGPQRQELEQHFAGMPVKFMVRGTAGAGAMCTCCWWQAAACVMCSQCLARCFMSGCLLSSSKCPAGVQALPSGPGMLQAVRYRQHVWVTHAPHCLPAGDDAGR